MTDMLEPPPLVIHPNQDLGAASGGESDEQEGAYEDHDASAVASLLAMTSSSPVGAWQGSCTDHTDGTNSAEEGADALNVLSHIQGRVPGEPGYDVPSVVLDGMPVPGQPDGLLPLGAAERGFRPPGYEETRIPGYRAGVPAQQQQQDDHMAWQPPGTPAPAAHPRAFPSPFDSGPTPRVEDGRRGRVESTVARGGSGLRVGRVLEARDP